MKNEYWKSVPEKYVGKWNSIFSKSREGPNLSANCPICQNKGLHRFYQVGKKIKLSVDSELCIAKGSEWQWCSYCRSFEHGEVLVPSWWSSELKIDGNKLTAIPEILDMAYKDESKITRWNSVPEKYDKLWKKIFNEHQDEAILNEKCPICGNKCLYQYYTLDIPGQVNYKKKKYKGQGAHWEWCAMCFHYRFWHLAYVPINWSFELKIDDWKLMTIPEPINEKIICYNHIKDDK